MINDETIKECRLEKEYNDLKDVFEGFLDDIEIFISTSKRTEKTLTLNRGGYSFDIKSNDLLEKECIEKGLNFMFFESFEGNLFNLIVFYKNDKTKSDKKVFWRDLGEIEIKEEEEENNTFESNEEEKLKEI